MPHLLPPAPLALGYESEFCMSTDHDYTRLRELLARATPRPWDYTVARTPASASPVPRDDETERLLAEADCHVHVDRYGYTIASLAAKVRELQAELRLANYGVGVAERERDSARAEWRRVREALREAADELEYANNSDRLYAPDRHMAEEIARYRALSTAATAPGADHA